MNLHIFYQPSSDLDGNIHGQNAAGCREQGHHDNHAPHPVQLNQQPTKCNLTSTGPLGLTHRQHKNQFVFFQLSHNDNCVINGNSMELKRSNAAPGHTNININLMYKVVRKSARHQCQVDQLFPTSVPRTIAGCPQDSLSPCSFRVFCPQYVKN